MFVVAQFFQDASGRDGDFGRVFLRVVGITEGVEHFVALFQIDAQFLGMGDIFIGQFFHAILPLLFLVLSFSIPKHCIYCVKF